MSDTPKLLFEGKFLHLLKEGHWEYAERPHSIHAVGVMAVTDDAKIILVQQYRIPVKKSVIEVPAGIVGDEEEFRGESLEATAIRELLEETGYRAGKMQKLLSSPSSSGLTSETYHLFLATNLIREHDGGGTENEDIIVHEVPLNELEPWLAQKEGEGLLIDAKIYAALHKAYPLLASNH